MRILRLDESQMALVGKKCVVCHLSCRPGQTIVYIPRRGVLFHRSCLDAFLTHSYVDLPKQPDERPGDPLFPESQAMAVQRQFDAYVRALASEANE